MKTSMQKFIVMFSVLFLGSLIPLSAHKEPTHQYIIREAYKLLKLQLGYAIPEFDTYIMGSNGMGNEGEFHDLKSANPWSYKTIPGGAWSEDQFDVVQEKHTEGTWLIDKGAYTTVSHFWNPDLDNIGHNSDFELALEWNPYPTGVNVNACAMARTWKSNYPQNLMAYKKALAYFGGRGSSPELNGTPGVLVNKNDNPRYIGQPTLIELYQAHIGNFTGFLTSTEDKKELIYNLIGRICHLLGDMSVPAHVQSYNGLMNEHGLWHDPYEDKMNYKQWSGNKTSPCDDEVEIPANTSMVEYWYAKKIFEEKGGVINPYCYPSNTNPIYHLFYTTAQIADHFATNRLGGDDYFPPSIGAIGEIQSIINEDYNSSHPGPTTTVFIEGNPSASGYSRDDADLKAIRDATFPYVIRATAGLLYYYAIEFGLLTNESTPGICPKDVYLQNLEIKGNNYIFKAKEFVQAGYNVNPAITQGNFVVNSAAKNVVFRAGNEIAFKNGFEARAGSQVHAYIAECDNCTTEELNPVITQRNSTSFMKKQDEPPENSKPLPSIIPIGTNVRYSFANSTIVGHLSHSSCGGSCCGKSGISKLILANSLGHNLIELTDNEGDLSEYEVEELSKKYPTGNYTFTVEHANGLVERRNIYTIQQ